jgi:hypothetical protein
MDEATVMSSQMQTGQQQMDFKKLFQAEVEGKNREEAANCSLLPQQHQL